MLVLTNTINFLLETQPQNSNLNALLDAISKVKDSSTLIAFIIAASLVALMIVMSSTQGLNRIYDTLLKNTAISGRQFERMFYAILLFMTVLALVLFGFLCFKITQPSQKPVIKITNPSPFSTIRFNADILQPVFCANSLLGVIFCILYILRAFNKCFDFLCV